jgi:ParB/RepB/Spo0J family partition protein
MADRHKQKDPQSGRKFLLPKQGPNFYKMEIEPAKIREIDENKQPERVEEIAVDDIAPSPNQTREIDSKSTDIDELVRSIQTIGLLQPIVVTPNTDLSSPYKWVLVAGERRLIAHKLLKLKFIRAFIKENLKDDKVKAWSATVSENVHRKQLTAKESFEAVKKAKEDLNLGINEIAEELNLSVKRVAQIEGTAKLPNDLLKILDEKKKMTKRHIDAFKLLIGRDTIDSIVNKEEDPEFIQIIKNQVNELLDEIIEGDLSGDEALKLARDIKFPKKTNSFLFTVRNRLTQAIKRRPSRMSDKKRIIVVDQAKEMINMLQLLIEEQEKMLNRTRKDINKN